MIDKKLALAIKKEVDYLWDFTLDNLKGNDWVLDRLDAILYLISTNMEGKNEEIQTDGKY